MNKDILHYQSRVYKVGTASEPDAPYCGCADWMDEGDSPAPADAGEPDAPYCGCAYDGMGVGSSEGGCE